MHTTDFFFNNIYHVSTFTLVKYFGDVLVISGKIICFLVMEQ